MTISLDHIKPVKTSTSDHQLVIGPELVHDGEYYLSKTSDGSIIATPADSVPEEERALWDNPALRESVKRGIQDAAEGRVASATDLLADVQID